MLKLSVYPHLLGPQAFILQQVILLSSLYHTYGKCKGNLYSIFK